VANAPQNGGIFSSCGKEYPLGHQVYEQRQIFVPFTPFYFFGYRPHHVVEASPLTNFLQVAQKDLPHSRVFLVEDSTATLDRHLPYQGHGEGSELLGKVLAAMLPRWGHGTPSRDRYVAPAAEDSQSGALLIEEVERLLLHRFDTVEADNGRAGAHAFFRTQRCCHLAFNTNIEELA
jgi:hypothetical protein